MLSDHKQEVPTSGSVADIALFIKRLNVLCGLSASHQEAAKDGFKKLMAECPQILSIVKFRSSKAMFEKCMQKAKQNGHLEIAEQLSAAKKRGSAELMLDEGKILEINTMLAPLLIHELNIRNIDTLEKEVKSSLTANDTVTLKKLLTQHKKIISEKPKLLTEWLNCAVVLGCSPTIIQFLLKQMTVEQINAKFESYTALHRAVMLDQPEAVRVLLESKGVDRRIKCDGGFPAVFYTVIKNKPAILTQFLAVMDEDEFDMQGQGGMSLLYCAVDCNSLASVKILLSDPRIDLRIKLAAKTILGSTALHCAVYRGAVQIVALLLEKMSKPDIDQLDNRRKTALHVAVEQHHTEIVRMLLELSSEKRPNLNLEDHGGNTPFWCAVKLDFLDIITLFLAELDTTAFNQLQYRGFPLLFVLIDEGKSALELILKDPRFRVGNIKDPKGYTPLHKAICAGKDELVIRFLPSMSADEINVSAGPGSVNALYTASRLGNASVVEALLENKEVEFTRLTKGGSSALDVAVFNGHKEVVAKLLQDPRIKTINCLSAFNWAIRCDQPQIVQMLLEHMGPEEINTPVNNPFWCALIKGNKVILKILLDSPKVSLTAPPLPMPPLHGAVVACDIDQVKFLENHSRIDKAQTHRGITAFQLTRQFYGEEQKALTEMLKSSLSWADDRKIEEIVKNCRQYWKDIINEIGRGGEKEEQEEKASLGLNSSLKPKVNGSLLFPSREVEEMTDEGRQFLEDLIEDLISEIRMKVEKEDKESLKPSGPLKPKVDGSFFSESARLSKEALRAAGYYKMSIPGLSLPAYAYVPPAIRAEAEKRGTWGVMEEQLKRGPKLLRKEDKGNGVKGLDAHTYELRIGGQEARIWTTEGFAIEEVLGIQKAHVLWFSKYGNHKALKRSMRGNK